MAEVVDTPEKMIVIGGSAGSLEIVLTLLEKIIIRDTCCLVIVLHRKNSDSSVLTELFSYKSHNTVKEAEDKEQIRARTIYIAPAGYHLLIEQNKIFALDSSEKINYSRPSIDVTFEQAGEVFKSYCTGILLSGANSDGAEGLSFIKQCGGITVVQDPSTAEVNYMPQSALNIFTPDHILVPSAIADFINNIQ